MARWKTTDEKKVAKHIITSRRTAEIFIKHWRARNKASREKALEKLKKLGIEISGLPGGKENKLLK